MSQAAQPNPAQVPTLTEVIELMAPMPVRESGLNNSPRPEAPPQGSLAAAPIVTRGLSSGPTEPWLPMSTLVVSPLASAGAQPSMVSLADLPVLMAEVAEVTELAGVAEVAEVVEVTEVAEVVEVVEVVEVAESHDVLARSAQPAPSVRAELPELPQLNEVVPEPSLMMPAAQQSLGLIPPAVAEASAVPLVVHPAAPAMQAVPPAQPALPVLPVLPDITEAQLAQRVLSDVQRQIDGMLEFRLREAMGPLLAKHSEALVRDLREELGRTMRDVVARSVTQEMAKLRQR